MIDHPWSQKKIKPSLFLALSPKERAPESFDPSMAGASYGVHTPLVFHDLLPLLHVDNDQASTHFCTFTHASTHTISSPTTPLLSFCAVLDPGTTYERIPPTSLTSREEHAVPAACRALVHSWPLDTGLWRLTLLARRRLISFPRR
jgi:hypothetical protein